MDKLSKLKKWGSVLSLSLGMACTAMGSQSSSNGQGKEKIVLLKIDRNEDEDICCRKIGKIIKWAVAAGCAIVITEAAYEALPPEYQSTVNHFIGTGVFYVQKACDEVYTLFNNGCRRIACFIYYE